MPITIVVRSRNQCLQLSIVVSKSKSMCLAHQAVPMPTLWLSHAPLSLRQCLLPKSQDMIVDKMAAPCSSAMYLATSRWPFPAADCSGGFACQCMLHKHKHQHNTQTHTHKQTQTQARDAPALQYHVQVTCTLYMQCAHRRTHTHAHKQTLKRDKEHPVIC